MLVDWTSQPSVESGVVERMFRVGDVPAVVWTPVDPPAPPGLVLLGHGGAGHKRADHQVRLARRLADAGLASAAIDGPYHGDRVPEPMPASEYQQRMIEAGPDVVTDGMVADWTATVEALSGLVDTTRVGYLGMSMGTRFGIPYAATASLRCAVLGKFGLSSPRFPPELDMLARIARDASAMSMPVLFHVQWDDENFPRDGQLELFDGFGSPDKQLIAFPGGHGVTDPAAIDAWQTFLLRHLIS